jgi:hypothetical protein
MESSKAQMPFSSCTHGALKEDAVMLLRYDPLTLAS